MSFEIYPKKVLMGLLFIISVLLILNIMGIVSSLYFGHSSVYGLVPMFNFDKEKNIPTLYSSLALMFSGGLLWIIAMTHRKNGSEYLSWLGLAAVFFFLSIDESMSIHERFGCSARVTLDILDTSWSIFNAWVIKYGIALVVFVIVYARFLRRLPKNIMILFIISGAIFVSGAIGLELLGGRQHELHGTGNLLYAVYYTLEEFLEMLGIAIFIYTLLTYIVQQFKLLAITVCEPK